MAKYRKKPIVVEAEVYRPGMEDGWAYKDSDGGLTRVSKKSTFAEVPIIQTLEGMHEISPGDYIVTGIKGERYPCKPDIFEKTYEKVE